MIYGIIHKGSGLGDQLFSYVATRVRAADLKVPYGFIGKEFFKGSGFMDLDWGQETNLEYHVEEPSGKVVISASNKVYELNSPSFDPEFNFIPDGSIIDGYGAQDIKYFKHRLGEIRWWLDANFSGVHSFKDDLCIINFRGGEYASVPDLFLKQEYWDEAMRIMKEKGIKEFKVHTDDPVLAKKFFPDLPTYTDIALNWNAIRIAKHLIISNSAFAILPALLNENAKEVIAPKFWAGRNVGEWRRPGNNYQKFTYI